MRTTQLLALLILGSVTATWAAPPHVYASYALQVSQPLGSFAGRDLLKKQGGADAGQGAEIDVGITTERFSVYIGRRVSDHTAGGSSQEDTCGVIADAEWGFTQAVVGFRWHLPKPRIPSASLTIGGGLSLNTVDVKANGRFWTSTQRETNFSGGDRSSQNEGWFLELGMIAAIARKVDFLGHVQYHHMRPYFETDIWEGSIEVSFFAGQAGIRYTF